MLYLMTYNVMCVTIFLELYVVFRTIIVFRSNETDNIVSLTRNSSVVNVKLHFGRVVVKTRVFCEQFCFHLVLSYSLCLDPSRHFEEIAMLFIIFQSANF